MACVCDSCLVGVRAVRGLWGPPVTERRDLPPAPGLAWASRVTMPLRKPTYLACQPECVVFPPGGAARSVASR